MKSVETLRSKRSIVEYHKTELVGNLFAYKIGVVSVVVLYDSSGTFALTFDLSLLVLPLCSGSLHDG